jgi:hypothetical protein
MAPLFLEYNLNGRSSLQQRASQRVPSIDLMYMGALVIVPCETLPTVAIRHNGPEWAPMMHKS